MGGILILRIIQFVSWSAALLWTTMLPLNHVGADIGTNIIEHSNGLSQPPPLSGLYLIRLAEIELYVYETLREISYFFNFTSEQEILAHISSFMGDFDTSSALVLKAKGDWALRISQNPLLVVRMIYRFAVDLPLVEAELGKFETPKTKEFLATLHFLIPKELRPDLGLLEDAMDRLVILMEIHDFEVADVVSGVFHNISTGFKLENRHCLAIGNYAFNYGYYALAVEFIQFTLDFYHSMSDQTGIQETETLLKEVILDHNSEHDHQELPSYNFFVNKIDVDVERPIRQRTFSNPNSSELLTYYSICSGRDYQSHRIKSELFCWLDFKLHSEFRINPLKVEVLSISPLLIQFHDIINQRDANELISVSEPRVESAFPTQNKTTRRGPWRAAYGVYINNTECLACRRLALRINHITKLDTRTTNLRLTTSTFGTGLLTHHDSIPEEFVDKIFPGVGNRLTTFLVYLKDIKGGGFTAFPEIGIGIKPVAGSAIFWYNLDSDENMDSRVRHAACPVFLGGPKWIATMVIPYGVIVNKLIAIEEFLISVVSCSGSILDLEMQTKRGWVNLIRKKT